MTDRGAGFVTRRAVRDLDSKYQLTGFARCALCGGGFGVLSGSHSTARQHQHVYGCLTYHKRGTTVCGNQLRLPLERVNHAVLGTLAGDLLRPPPVVMSIIDRVLEELTLRSSINEQQRWRAELEGVDRAITNPGLAIADVGELGPLLEQLRAARATL